MSVNWLTANINWLNRFEDVVADFEETRAVKRGIILPDKTERRKQRWKQRKDLLERF